MRDKIIEIASKEVGYKEKPFNLTKFGEWFGWNGVAWCGIFVTMPNPLHQCYNDKLGDDGGSIRIAL